MTNVRERNKIQTVKDIKAVKRRVGEEIRRRESRQVGRDMEGFFEHGLGALHRLRIRTGYPADADRLQREYPLSYLTIDERLFVRSCRRIKVVPRKNVPPLNFNLRAVFYYVKKRRTDQRILQAGK